MEKINWQNGESGGTPLSAENLNLMQDNIENAIEEKQVNIDEQCGLLNEKIVGTVLYEDETGTSGDITLNEAIENFKYFEIESYVVYTKQKVYVTTGKLPIFAKDRVHLNNSFVGGNNFMTYCKRVNILGTDVAVQSDRSFNETNIADGNFTYITKITGYEEV